MRLLDSSGQDNRCQTEKKIVLTKIGEIKLLYLQSLKTRRALLFVYQLHH